MRCGEKSYIWRRDRQFALSLVYKERNGFARAVKQPPNTTLKRNLEAHRNNLRRDHITPGACNFLSEDVIKRPWDRNTSERVTKGGDG